jgi:hypothetical protein
MSYRLKVLHTKEYTLVGIKNFREAQQEAIIAARVARGDILLISEHTDDVIAVAKFIQEDDISLELDTTGITDSPWL